MLVLMHLSLAPVVSESYISCLIYFHYAHELPCIVLSDLLSYVVNIKKKRKGL